MSDYDGFAENAPTPFSAARPPVMIGCAGWSIPARTSEAFPGEGSHLERYAQVLPAVEINSSFYRSHQPKTYTRWAATVPAHFRFSVKMPRAITHDNRLQQPHALLRQFLDEVGNLGEKLGCLLMQLPPSLVFDPGMASDFMQLLRESTDIPMACEPRHASWFGEAAAQMFRQSGVACVIADPSPVPGAVPAGSNRLAYLRLHGSPVIYRSAYTPAFLAAVNTRIEAYLAAGKADAVWCIFDNTAEGAAAVDALHLLRLRPQPLSGAG